MGKDKKKRKSTLKEGSRAFRRQVKNPHQAKKVMAGMRDYIESKAADRPNYIKLFFAMWENAVAAVDGAAENILTHQHVGIDKESWTSLYEPYGMWQCIYFARLMDHLEMEEEQRLLDVQEQYNRAWQKFCAATLVRHPDLREVVDRIAENRRAAHEEIVNLYTGESLPALTPRWAKAYEALERAYKPLSEGLLK